MNLIKEFIAFYISFLKFAIGKKQYFYFKSSYKKVAYFFTGNIISSILAVFIMVLLAYILNFFNYPKPIYSDILKHHSDCMSNYFFLSLLFGGILAPIIEELVFRLPLKYTKWNFVIAIIAFYFLTFVSQSAMCDLTVGNLMERFTYKRSLIFLLILIFTIILTNIKAIEKLLGSIINSHGWWFYFLLSILFGSIHTEPLLILKNFPWLILQGAPQILAGLYFGYIRLSYGIKYSILTHSVWNLVALILIKL